MNNMHSEESPNSKYNPTSENPNYQREKPFALTDEVRKDITEAVRSINMEEIRFVKTLTLPERVQIACAMTAVDEQNRANRLRQSDSEVSQLEALRIVRGGWEDYLWQRRRYDP